MNPRSTTLRRRLEFTSLPGGGSGEAFVDEGLLVFYFAMAAVMAEGSTGCRARARAGGAGQPA